MPQPLIAATLRITGNVVVGHLTVDALALVLQHPYVFVRDKADPTIVWINESLTTPAARTEAVERVALEWRSMQLYPCLKGWRNERYSVWGAEGAVVMEIERAVAGILGFRCYGCHINGYFRRPDGEIMMWIARRSKTKQTYPNMLDNLTGGGLPHGLHPDSCAVKECFEEAGLTEADLRGRLKAHSFINFLVEDHTLGYAPCTEFIYDLELPEEWKPACQDGEVQEFSLMKLDEVLKRVENREFTPEAGLTCLDFLYRHRKFDTESHHSETARRLREPLPIASHGSPQVTKGF